MRTALIAATIVAAAQQVAAHGYVPQIKIGSQYIPGWDVAKDPYTTPKVRFVTQHHFVSNKAKTPRIAIEGCAPHTE